MRYLVQFKSKVELDFLYQTIQRYNIWYQGIYLEILLYDFLETFQIVR